MNDFSLIFLAINAAALLLLPRRWAPLPFLVGACYMTLGQGIEVGPLHFPVIRLLLAVGIFRVIVRGERLAYEMNALDRLMILWAAWALCSSLFHGDVSATLVNRLGLVYNACCIYFLLRVFCRSLDDVVTLCLVTAILLVPLSLMVLAEKVTGYNPFSVLGGVYEISESRLGTIRAQGPFAHPILAGMVGAACLPLMIGLWHRHRKAAVAGIVACFLIVFASSSSGPIMSVILAAGALIMWRWRSRMRLLRWFAVLGYIGLDLVMKAPAYYLIARVDLTGASTGWHRAALIEAAIEHFSEWWIVGTDFTRHWLPYGVGWSENHVDFTNHYLQMGVWGGMPLMLLFIAMVVKGFSLVGQGIAKAAAMPPASRFMIWALGASLFSHAMASFTISYFDQSFLFVYLTFAAISAAAAGAPVGHRLEQTNLMPKTA